MQDYTDMTFITIRRDIIPKSNRSPFTTPEEHNINSSTVKRLKNELEVECRSGNSNTSSCSTHPPRQSGLDIFIKQSNRSTNTEDSIISPIVSSPITINNTRQTADSPTIWNTPFYHTSEQLERVAVVVNQRVTNSNRNELTEGMITTINR